LKVKNLTRNKDGAYEVKLVVLCRELGYFLEFMRAVSTNDAEVIRLLARIAGNNGREHDGQTRDGDMVLVS
jgi:hypothetical protein